MSAASASIYTDFQGLTELKAQARQDESGSLDEVARQFESVLTQMMISSMREASMGESEMDSEQSLFYRDMYDKQLSLHLSQGGGLGLAAVIKRQLSAAESLPDQAGRAIDAYRSMPVTASSIQAFDSPPFEPAELKIDGPASFIQQLWPQAEKAAQTLGLPTEALLAQAALESGWGQGMIRHADGANSHNLFGIKADQRWDGERVTVSTLEYEQGVAVRKRAYFRAYASYEESFRDYVDFVQLSPRYQAAQEAAAHPDDYFRKLQDAGYATDPAYAEKVMRVMQGSEMSVALQQFKNEATQPL